MNRSRIPSCLVVFCVPFALLAIPVQAATLEGRVYEGDVGNESQPLSGVTVALYGSNNSGQLGNLIISTTTDSQGWYGLEVREGYEYYNIVETDPPGYSSVGSTSVGGTVVGSNQIEYPYPLSGKTLTGNKFWDKRTSPRNNPPVANAGPDQMANAGSVVHLNGSGSSDMDGDPLTYSWSLISVPVGSSAVLDNLTVVQPKFTADRSGTYVAQLVVNDGKVDSSPDTVVVIATSETPRTGTISGNKFNDLNGDGIWNATESGLAGWTIFADMNPWNAKLDQGEASAVTGPDGSYSLTGLAPGIYNVYEVAQAGWQVTCPSSGFYGITIAGNDLWDGRLFGNHRTGEQLEACCLPNGSCANLTPQQCRERGGTPQGPGTACMGDSNGDGVDDICGGIPQSRFDIFNMCLVLDLDIPGLGHSKLTVTGPGVIEVSFEGPAPGAAMDHNGNGRDELATRLVSLNLTGMDPIYGTVKVGLNPALASNGQLEERVNATPGMLDLPPFAPTGQADSFFDVFFEIELPNLGLTLRTNQAKRIQAVLDQVPATQPVYTEPAQTTVPLLRQPGGTQVGSLGPLNSCQAGSRRDYGDAPAPYPDASHVPGKVWLGFAAPDTEAGTQASPLGDGDDTHGIDDEDGAWFMSDLVPGQFTWLALALSGLNQDLTFAVWIDYNRNGNWEHPGELYSSGNAIKLAASPLGLVIANPIPASAQIGTTFMRVRVFPGLNVAVSPSSDAQGGEVEDYQVEIKRTGVIQPPGHWIAGIKFNDLDGDGFWDPADGELLLPNWPIWLDTNNDGTPDLTTTTDSKGGFEFTSIQPGTYTLGEQQQAGWTQTAPAGAGTYTVTVPGGLQPTISFAMFGNQRTQEDRELDFGDAPDSYMTLQASGGAYHKAGPLTLGPSVDIETDGVPSPDATGDDLADKDDEDGLMSSLNLTTGQIATVSLTVANDDAASDSGMVAGWIDFDGNGQFDWVSDGIGTQYVAVPGSGQATVQFTFLVPAGSKAGKTYARFRLYRDDPNPMAIPWAILPTGEAGYGEVEDYVATIRSGISSNDRDYGDAPLPYPSADHPLGGPYLGPFGDLPDRDPGMQRDATASGDDTDADGDDEDGLLSVNLVKTSGVWSHAEIKMWTSSTGALTGAIWIDWNADGDWDDSGELVGSAGLSATPVPPGGAWIHVLWGFQVPGVAKPGSTFARLRVYEGFNVTPSPNGSGGAGEVEDHLVQIKADGPGLPPGGIVHGYKWDDQDGDGAWDVAEPGLAGWQIWLDLNGNGVEDTGDRYETTDGSGYFRFTGVPAGSYLVGEKAQSGWTQTCPAAPGTYAETVTPGSASVALMFGNTHRSVQPPPDKRKLDWGDAPDPTYPTLRASNGAYHVILPGFQLGGAIDPELDGQPTIWALGDDAADAADEDGVLFQTPILPGQIAQIQIVASAPGKMDAWIDFDVDGTWAQASDQILKAQAVNAGSNVLNVPVPATAKKGVGSFARFRLSTQGGLPSNGPGLDGEVEDYRILLGDGGPYDPNAPGFRPPHLKWSQPPIEIDPNLNPNSGPPVFCGWDEPSLSIRPVGETRRWSFCADDFPCLGPIPVTRIRWWGSYKGWDRPDLPAVQPVRWWIAVWTDAPVNVPTHVARPGQVIWQIEVPADRIQIGPVGLDSFPQQAVDQAFAYDLRLEPQEFFWQPHVPGEIGLVFWLSVTAIYGDDVNPENPWGWLVRPHAWREAGMRVDIGAETPHPGLVLDPAAHACRWLSSITVCSTSQPYDLTFELLTEEPWIKWDLPIPSLRDWPYATDRPSMAIEDEKARIQVLTRVADDWVCRSPEEPVIALAWYGSYIGYGYEACRCEQAPGPRRPDSFLISIWTDAPANNNMAYARPGRIVWEYKALTFEEVMVGYDGTPPEGPNEPVFRYTVRLPQPLWFWQEKTDQVYWLSIVAVYKATGTRIPIPYPWGWTDRPHDSGSIATAIEYEPGIEPRWRILRDPLDRGVDMGFTLYTRPPGP